MKRALTLSLVLLSVLFQLFSVSAQTDIVTTITPKVRMFPATGFSYLDDPGRYFNIQMVNTTMEEKQIYFTISLSCEFSATNESFFVNTKKEYQPNTPLTIGATPLLLHRNHFDQLREQLSREPRPLPRMVLNPEVKSIDDYKYEDFTLEGYDPWPAIKGVVSV